MPRLLVEIVGADRSLAPLCLQPSKASTETRQRLGTRIVNLIQKARHRLSPAILQTKAPHPTAVLESWTISDRTRNVLDRLLPQIEKLGPWTIGRYLQLPQFGAYCLVDLLSAAEEWPGGDNVQAPAPITARLGEITGLLNRLAPMAGSAIDSLLQEQGVVSANLSLPSLVSAYADAGVSFPFRIVRHDGADVVVPAGQVELVTSVVTLAKRLVTDWGLVSVEQLTERLRSRGSAIEDALIVRRILSCLPRLRWLDEERAWFSFQGEKSHLGLDVRKVFAIARRVSFCDLRLALLKGRPQVAQAPLRTLEGYLSKVSNCDVDGDWVRPRGPAAAPFLSATEQLVVGVLEQFGGEMPLKFLKEQISLLPVAETALARIIKVSPLLIRTDGDRVCLIGLASQELQPTRNTSKPAWDWQRPDREQEETAPNRA